MIECPACDAQWEPDDELANEATCPGCGLELILHTEVVYQYYPECKEHDWPEWTEDAVTTWCRKCGKCRVRKALSPMEKDREVRKRLKELGHGM